MTSPNDSVIICDSPSPTKSSSEWMNTLTNYRKRLRSCRDFKTLLDTVYESPLVHLRRNIVPKNDSDVSLVTTPSSKRRKISVKPVKNKKNLDLSVVVLNDYAASVAPKPVVEIGLSDAETNDCVEVAETMCLTPGTTRLKSLRERSTPGTTKTRVVKIVPTRREIRATRKKKREENSRNSVICLSVNDENRNGQIMENTPSANGEAEDIEVVWVSDTNVESTSQQQQQPPQQQQPSQQQQPPKQQQPTQQQQPSQQQQQPPQQQQPSRQQQPPPQEQQPPPQQQQPPPQQQQKQQQPPQQQTANVEQPFFIDTVPMSRDMYEGNPHSKKLKRLDQPYVKKTKSQKKLERQQKLMDEDNNRSKRPRQEAAEIITYNRTNLREIVVDGCNVAMGHKHGTAFSEKGLQIVIDYFKERGHVVTAFLPQTVRSRDRELLEKLHTSGYVVFTPSRVIGGKKITPYDDRYILEYATKCNGIVVSSDQYRDLWREKPQWRDTIENRLLTPTFVGDYLMFPEDPLGRTGPKLEEFLRY